MAISEAGVAGIAVGCSIGGLVIGGIIMYFVYKYIRRDDKSHISTPMTLSVHDSQTKTPHPWHTSSTLDRSEANSIPNFSSAYPYTSNGNGLMQYKPMSLQRPDKSDDYGSKPRPQKTDDLPPMYPLGRKAFSNMEISPEYHTNVKVNPAFENDLDHSPSRAQSFSDKENLRMFDPRPSNGVVLRTQSQLISQVGVTQVHTPTRITSVKEESTAPAPARLPRISVPSNSKIRVATELVSLPPPQNQLRKTKPPPQPPNGHLPSAGKTPVERRRDRIGSTESEDADKKSICSDAFRDQGAMLTNEAFDFLDEYNPAE